MTTYRDFVPPSGLGERARQWVTSPGEVAAPRAASTVVLVRDGEGGPEVFLMRRQPTMAFAAGMAVFPGGGVDARDGDDLALPWAGPGPDEWALRLGVDAGTAVELVCAAVRETFEECGVLLATAPGAQAFPTVDDEGWEAERQRLLAREVALSDLLVERGLVLRSDLLRPWARWIDPGVRAPALRHVVLPRAARRRARRAAPARRRGDRVGLVVRGRGGAGTTAVGWR